MFTHKVKQVKLQSLKYWNKTFLYAIKTFFDN